MRATDPRLQAALLFAVTAVLVALHPGAIAWSARALPLYLVGRFPTQEERDLYGEAARAVNEDRDYVRARELLERVNEIDPYTYRYWLAEVYRREERVDEALAHFQETVRIDPLQAQAHLRIVEILGARGLASERRAALDRAVEVFRRAVVDFEPRLDPNVGSEYNRKAVELHQGLRTSLQRFERLRERAESARPRP